MSFTNTCSDRVKRLSDEIKKADAVIIGGGAGLSTSAGFTYDGARFEKYFSDFKAKYGFSNMYQAGFYPFETPEEKWAFWSRYIYVNRYMDPPKPVYNRLLDTVRGKDYFVLTTNVDHMFIKAGFEKARLFYTQGDFGLWQCEKPCHEKTYDNEAVVRRMFEEQSDMRVPPELVPHCPVCGRPMTMNLRSDDTFVEDSGWNEAAERYAGFIKRHEGGHVLFLELGVGGNTPGIIKYPFWQYTYENKNALFASIDIGEQTVPREIESRSVLIAGDIWEALQKI